MLNKKSCCRERESVDAPCIRDAVEALDEVERAFVHVVWVRIVAQITTGVCG